MAAIKRSVSTGPSAAISARTPVSFSSDSVFSVSLSLLVEGPVEAADAEINQHADMPSMVESADGQDIISAVRSSIGK
jgi:hypothetical protein